MFEVLLPESHVRQKSTRAAVGAFLAHVCVITAAVSGTAPAPVPVMLDVMAPVVERGRDALLVKHFLHLPHRRDVPILERALPNGEHDA